MSSHNSGAPGGLSFGDPDEVFDETGRNASGRVLDAASFYALAIFNMVLGFAALGIVAYMFRHWNVTGSGVWWYLAAMLGVLVSMFAGSALAIKSQNWAISLAAYLVLVAGAFGVLFGPFVSTVGANHLVPGLIITSALMVLACLIGLALPRNIYQTWFGTSLFVALIAYLILSVALVKTSAHNPTVLIWVAAIGIVLFFFMTINDSNRMKSIAHKDVDNAVDAGMQLWLNAINILLRVMTILAAKKS